MTSGASSPRPGRRRGRGFERGQRPPRVPRREPHDHRARVIRQLDRAVQPARVDPRPLDQHREVLVVERLERQQQRARQQRRDHRERRVLRRRGDEDDPAVLDARQQRILLGLREAVDLVEEEHRREPVQVAWRTAPPPSPGARRARRR